MSNLRSLCLALCALALVPGAGAQTYPAKPVRLVVPYPPGGSNDVLSRITAQAMTPGLGQPVVIDNRGGAGGMIGADHVAKSAPDGYTLVNVQASFTANAALRAKLAYDPLGDFAYIGMMARGPLLAVVHPSLPVKNVKDLIALARARPGQINYGSTGTGGHNHMATELFARMAAIRIVHIPYKGVAPALTDLMGGHTQMVMTSLPSAMNQVKAGRLKAIAVGSEKRSSFMPEMPTISESGVPGYFAEFWWGIAAPAKTPAPILDRLASELGKALQSSELKQKFATEGAEPSPLTREQFTRFIANEITRWRKVARDANIRAE
ncbi:MAG: tripartite tricarboxylate transporter substrate binding protein [Betaproteobacteria bacterium]|nr:tripartite tricarboxylate transporter substrate binding protein [Betaproteobacteria bacterium]